MLNSPEADERHLGEGLDLPVDGRLGPERRPQIEARLAECVRCRRELNGVRSSRSRIQPTEMYEGRLDELPAAADERHNNGIRFRVYRIRNATLVFWQEGRVVCVLISYGEPEERSNSPSPKPSE